VAASADPAHWGPRAAAERPNGEQMRSVRRLAAIFVGLCLAGTVALLVGSQQAASQPASQPASSRPAVCTRKLELWPTFALSSTAPLPQLPASRRATGLAGKLASKPASQPAS